MLKIKRKLASFAMVAVMALSIGMSTGAQEITPMSSGCPHSPVTLPSTFGYEPGTHIYDGVYCNTSNHVETIKTVCLYCKDTLSINKIVIAVKHLTSECKFY